MPDASRSVKMVTVIFVLMLMSAFLLPTAVSAFVDNEGATVTLNTSETVELQPGLNATLDSTSTGSPDTATFTLAYDGDTTTSTIDNQTSSTVTVGGEDVTVEVTDVTSSDATADFGYDPTIGWGSAGALWFIIPLMLILPVFLLAVRMGTNST